MQVQRVQFNNTLTLFRMAREKEIVFKGNNKIKNLQIDNKNPLITDEVRNVANDLNRLFKSVEGKTLIVEGLSVEHPVDASLNIAFDDIKNSKKVNLRLYKNSIYAEQIQSAELKITEKGNPARKIAYYPRRQINGVWTDDLISCYVRKGMWGIEDYNYSYCKPELNDIFVKYGKEFITKLKKLVKYYK